MIKESLWHGVGTVQTNRIFLQFHSKTNRPLDLEFCLHLFPKGKQVRFVSVKAERSGRGTGVWGGGGCQGRGGGSQGRWPGVRVGEVSGRVVQSWGGGSPTTTCT